jgi:cytochrome c oxidase subunit 4
MSQHHVVPLRVYFAIFLSLMVLTAVTVFVAFIDLGRMSDVVAMAIAFTKASLVILYFMHVRYSPALVGLSVVAGIAFLAIFVFFTMSDYMTRTFFELFAL